MERRSWGSRSPYRKGDSPYNMQLNKHTRKTGVCVLARQFVFNTYLSSVSIITFYGTLFFSWSITWSPIYLWRSNIYSCSIRRGFLSSQWAGSLFVHNLYSLGQSLILTQEAEISLYLHWRGWNSNCIQEAGVLSLLKRPEFYLYSRGLSSMSIQEAWVQSLLKRPEFYLSSRGRSSVSTQKAGVLFLFKKQERVMCCCLATPWRREWGEVKKLLLILDFGPGWGEWSASRNGSNSTPGRPPVQIL
jgi:hypothetical protein